MRSGGVTYYVGFLLVQPFLAFGIFMVAFPEGIANWWADKMRNESPWRSTAAGAKVADAMTPRTIRRHGVALAVTALLAVWFVFVPELLPMRPQLTIAAVCLLASFLLLALATWRIGPSKSKRAARVWVEVGGELAIALALLIFAIYLSAQISS